jgi:hypothetical protein
MNAQCLAIAFSVIERIVSQTTEFCMVGRIAFGPTEDLQSFLNLYFGLKVKSAVPGFPAATVTFCVWVP